MESSFEHPAAMQALEQAGHTFRRMEYDYVLRGGTKDAAEKLNVPEYAVVKSLVFCNGEAGADLRGVIALMHGSRRVSLHKLERLCNMRHLRPASPQEAEELTGFLPGGICPFGTRTALPVVMQSSLRELPEVYVNAGVRGVVAAVAPAVFDMLSPLEGDIMNEADRKMDAEF